MNETDIKILKNRLSELVEAVQELKTEMKTLLGEERTQEPTPSFDFQAVYGLYPRKMGKTLGLRKCRAQIKSQDDYNALLKAVQRFRNYTRASHTEEKFIPHFSTWITGWKDWLEKDTGVKKDQFHESTAEYLARKEMARKVEEGTEEGPADPERVKALMGQFFKNGS